MTNTNRVEMRKITKHFGGKHANTNVDLQVRRGEILALLGENGSGKTTLMNVLAGIYYPDGGHIFIDGKEVDIRSPRDAYDLGIGMIHQHFKLVPVLTAAENMILGIDEKGRLDRKKAAEKMRAIADMYGFDIDPERKIYDMTVSEKQTVEIIKVLYRGADILILDEPTAVLTPQETETLFKILRKMRDDGKSVIIITHKLQEVLDISDRVAVLRKGEYIGTVETKESTALSLTEMMVGRAVKLNIERPEPKDRKCRLALENVSCSNAEGIQVLDNVSFEVYSGEILGIAGISGNGQKELLEAVAGLKAVTRDSSIRFFPEDDGEFKELVGLHPLDIRKLGITMAFVPEDRLGMGLVGSMNMIDNMMLRSYRRGRIFTDRKSPKMIAQQVYDRLSVNAPDINTPIRRLSGGNVQKVLVGREIASSPKVLMTAYAVRGLDINTSYMIYDLLTEQKQNGAAVVYVGEDLDVLLALCDRILVLCGGKVSGIVDARTTTKEEIGLLMTQSGGGDVL